MIHLDALRQDEALQTFVPPQGWNEEYPNAKSALQRVN